jgi:hypothetical protein
LSGSVQTASVADRPSSSISSPGIFREVQQKQPAKCRESLDGPD